MNKSLSTFMMLAATAFIVFGLIGGVLYTTLVDKYDVHKEVVNIQIER